MYANLAYKALFGWGEETIGMSSSMHLSPAALERDQEDMILTAIGGRGWSGESEGQRKNGTIFPMQISVFGLHDKNGKSTNVAVIIRDISQQKAAEAERERLQQQVIEAQKQALIELSTPIIQVDDGIIIVPLIGTVDTSRARDITRGLLAGISQYRARIVILDITGVPLVDTGVADHLNRTIQAVRLKGAKTIITGISDAVAETIVDLGIDWTKIETRRDLQSGLKVALETPGHGKRL